MLGGIALAIQWGAPPRSMEGARLRYFPPTQNRDRSRSLSRPLGPLFADLARKTPLAIPRTFPGLFAENFRGRFAKKSEKFATFRPKFPAKIPSGFPRHSWGVKNFRGTNNKKIARASPHVGYSTVLPPPRVLFRDFGGICVLTLP